MTMNRTHTIRALLCAAALLSAAPALHAQCTWEADPPPGRREAEDALAYRTVHQAQLGAIRSALRAAGVSEPKGVVIVTSEGSGAAPVISTVEANFPRAALDAAAPVLVQRMKELPERQGARVASVLRLDTTALPPARADGRRRDCKPTLLNRALVLSEIRRWARSARETDRGPRPVLVGLALSRDGRVLYAEVIRSSGSQPLDRFALALAERLNFDAATLDGVPRDVWAVLPIELR